MGMERQDLCQVIRYQNENYNEILKSFNNAIIKIKLDYIDLIITHSYYGDEKKHPRHIITHNFSKKYAKENNIPFSYFSTLQIPSLNHVSMLNNYYRKKGLHLLNLSKCNDNLYYVQFQGNLKISLVQKLISFHHNQIFGIDWEEEKNFS
mgnify:CR=1 FL=1